MWCTMLILIPIMLEDNIMWSRDEMFNSYHNVLNQHGELQHHQDQVTIVNSLCSVDWTTSISWSPELSMLSYHNYVWQLSALLQPCKADHHHGWGRRRWSGINTRLLPSTGRLGCKHQRPGQFLPSPFVCVAKVTYKTNICKLIALYHPLIDYLFN